MSRTFGGSLRKMRRQSNMALVELSGAVGRSVSYLADIERGRRYPPKPEDIGKLLEYLGHEDQLPELLRLAARARGKITFQVDETTDPEVADTLLMLSTRYRAGSLDREVAIRMRELIDQNQPAAV